MRATIALKNNGNMIRYTLEINGQSQNWALMVNLKIEPYKICLQWKTDSNGERRISSYHIKIY